MPSAEDSCTAARSWSCSSARLATTSRPRTSCVWCAFGEREPNPAVLTAPSTVVLDVACRILVFGVDAAGVLRLEGGKGNGDLVAKLPVGVMAEVGEVLPLLLSHVIAVGLLCLGDGLPPVLATDRVLRRLLDGVADLVVVLDHVGDLFGSAVLSAGAGPDLEKVWIEQPLLSLGVHLESDTQACPDGVERIGVGSVDVVQVREHAPLLLMVVEDDVGDVHGYLERRGCVGVSQSMSRYRRPRGQRLGTVQSRACPRLRLTPSSLRSPSGRAGT